MLYLLFFLQQEAAAVLAPASAGHQGAVVDVRSAWSLVVDHFRRQGPRAFQKGGARPGRWLCHSLGGCVHYPRTLARGQMPAVAGVVHFKSG